MKWESRILASLVLGLVVLSCNKSSATLTESAHTSLPNFGNVQLEEVFTDKDNRIKGKNQVVSVIDNYYQQVWEKGNLWGGFLVAKGDAILYESYRGFSQDKEIGPIGPETALHVASVSKTLTAMAVLKLVESGKLQLDQTVDSILKGFPYPQVTIKQLLNQRSGLPKYEHFLEKIDPASPELNKKYLTNEDILSLMIRYKPEMARKPDTGFMYCNTNYALLALVLERVTGESYPEAMKQMVFIPLGMNNTYVLEEHLMDKAAKSFFARGPSIYPYDRLDLIYGDKNIFTTPRNLLNFSRAMYSPDFLESSLMKQVFMPYSNERPGINNYGLGFRMKVYDPQSKLTYHNGWWHGSNSVFAHLRSSKVTIIAIGNKYSQRIYSSLALSALFENFPYEVDKLYKTIDSSGQDIAQIPSGE